MLWVSTDHGGDLWRAPQICCSTREMLGQEANTENLVKEGRGRWDYRNRMATEACTASRSPRSWSVWAPRTYGCMRPVACSSPVAPKAARAATAPTTWTGCAAFADLLEAGLNLAGIGMVLDLEAQNTHLRAEKEAAVAEDRIDPSDLMPEADHLEQQARLDPQRDKRGVCEQSENDAAHESVSA